MRQLKPQDAQFIFMEDAHVAAHVTGISICDQSTAPDGIVRFKEILAVVEKRLGQSTMFDRRLMRLPFDLDFPYWVEDQNFELEYHVRHARLPEPSDWRQLCIQIARLHSRPMDLNRAPWEMHIIEGLNNIEGVPNGAFALVLKLHHSAFDGTSATQFAASMMDLGPEGPPVLPAANQSPKKSAPISANAVAARAAIGNATAPVRMARTALKYVPKVAREQSGKLLKRGKSGSGIPKTRFNGEISPNRAFDATVFSLADLKRIASAFGDAKVNDVSLAICGGALREYLHSKNELPDQSLKVTAPVNLRSKKATASDADGNNISSMSVPIYTNIANPVDRLKAIVRASQSVKRSKSGHLTRMVTEVSQHVPAPAISALGPLLLNSGLLSNEPVCNAIVSSVPGFPMATYFCGAKLLQSFGMAPIGSGVGLFIATPSYNGQIAFCLTTTRQIMPDTPYFIECLRRSFDELQAAAEKKLANTPIAPGVARRKGKAYHRTRPKGTSSLPVVPKNATPKPKRAAAASRTASANKTKATKTKPASKRKKSKLG